MKCYVICLHLSGLEGSDSGCDVIGTNKLQLFYLQEISRSANNLGPYTLSNPVPESG